ncbi:MAG TPA: hypothetical protein VJ553_01295 [Candidatus Paceibacterota bacterium]|nr:hypothetical protein [Candidatus Paceibacterota bacterium]
MTLHPNVQLAVGVEVPEAAWYLHGHILRGGILNHRVIIRGFPLQGDGTVGIIMTVMPLETPELLPLRFRES